MILVPVCTFKRVFDTTPSAEVVTLPELTAALRRFELKPQTLAAIERDLGRIRQAVARWKEGRAPSGKFMGKLARAADEARRAGQSPDHAVESLATALEEEARRSAKRDLRLWSPAVYRPGATERGSENVTHVSCLVLDYDDGTPIADASESWSAFFHIVHTTWSHRPERPKFRLVLPLAFPVAAEDWGKVWTWAEARAHFEIDPSMKSPAASYALPAVPSADWAREAFSRPGAILDPVDEGVLTRRVVLDLRPHGPLDGSPSVMRGMDPEKEYLDHEDPDALYVVDEPWAEDAWDPEPPVHLVQPSRAPSAGPRSEGVPEPREDADALVSALERLIALHERGALTADELQEAKAAVLRGGGHEPDLRPIGPARRGRTIAVDFDGVLHSYASGWRGATQIDDPPVEGAIQWLTEAVERFDVAIHSVRTAHPGAVAAMRAWLREHGLSEQTLERIRFPLHKPAAEIYVDDRAWRFEGRFPRFEELALLVPWTRGRG